MKEILKKYVVKWCRILVREQATIFGDQIIPVESFHYHFLRIENMSVYSKAKNRKKVN